MLDIFSQLHRQVSRSQGSLPTRKAWRKTIADRATAIEHLEGRTLLSGTAIVLENSFPGGGITGGAYDLTNVGGTLYFRAVKNGTGTNTLWRMNASGVAAEVSGTVPGGGITGGPKNVSQMINVNGTLYFRGNDGTNGEELWRINGSGLAEMVEDSIPGGGIAPGAGIGSEPLLLTNVNGTLYFQARDSINGPELWRINSAGIAEMVEDSTPGGGIKPGTGPGAGGFLESLTNVNGTLYFSADVDDNINGPRLWRVNNSGIAETVTLSIPGGAYFPEKAGMRPANLTNVNGTLYFTSSDGFNQGELWRVNSSGVAEVVEDSIAGIGIRPGYTFSAYITNLTNVNGTLYFTGFGGTTGAELWRVNSSGLAELVEDAVPGGGIAPGSDSANPQLLTNVNGTLYFAADDGVNGFELWRINSSGSAELVEDAIPGGGINPGNASSGPGILTDVNGTPYFRADDGVNGAELWRINASGIAEMVEDAIPGGGIRPGADYPDLRYLTNVNGTLYFQANDGTNGAELWRVNNVGQAEMVEDPIPGGGLVPGADGSFPRMRPGEEMIEINGITYFNARGITNPNQVLWAIQTNVAPTNLALSVSVIGENLPTSTLVGLLSATDPNISNTFTYSLVSGTGNEGNSSFQILGNQLRTSGVFDYEAKSNYSIRIRTTDQEGLSFEKVFTITVTNGNDAPTDITLSANNIAENNAIGTTIGTFSSTDPDGGNTFAYALVAGVGSTDNAAFTITGNTLKAAIGFNFESKSSYSVRVKSTDQGGLTTEKVFTINVTNTNDAPVLDTDGIPTLNAIRNNITNSNNLGTLVSTIIARMAPDGGLADEDAGALRGIAINGLSGTANGIWQFTINDGISWESIGTTGNGNARLLAADAVTRIRFVPNAGFVGQPLASFVAWDQTGGSNGAVANVAARGGSTPYSLLYELVSINVQNQLPPANSVGVFRDGKFYLDANNNHAWDGVAGGDALYSFGITTDTPIVGDWNGDGITDIGIFRSGKFYLDANGNHTWDSTIGGDALISFGATTDVPVVGDWNADGISDIGTFRSGKFYLDTNGNRKWDGTEGGDQLASFSSFSMGDIPVIGDWNGDGISDVGIYRAPKFRLDLNANHTWDNNAGGDVLASFGTVTDRYPITGDWNGDGKTDIGMRRGTFFYFDSNANYAWDNNGEDTLVIFGVNGDIPLIGLWQLPPASATLRTSSLRSAPTNIGTPISGNLPGFASTQVPTAAMFSPAAKKQLNHINNQEITTPLRIPSLNFANESSSATTSRIDTEIIDTLFGDLLQLV